MPMRGHEPDYKLILCIATLLVFGLIMLASASMVTAQQRFGESYFFLKRQLLLGVVPGLAIFLLFAKIHYQRWQTVSRWLFWISLGLLVSVFIPGLGEAYNTGSQSWIAIGSWSFQPGEIFKLAFLLSLASWLAKSGVERVSSFWGGSIFFIWLGLVIILMILQPDTGTMMVITLMAISMYFIAGARIWHLLVLGLLGVVFLGVLIQQSPYRMDRVMIFLHPEYDPQGIGYHMNQAFLAIGSGGWFGRGFVQSKQKFNFLPEVSGDSIFAILAEELGFFFAIGLVGAILYLGYRGYRIAQNSQDNFAKFVAIGVTSWLLWQSFINIGAMVGVVPITGVPLPLMSLGGTAMFINLAALGILINISKYTKSII